MIVASERNFKYNGCLPSGMKDQPTSSKQNSSSPMRERKLGDIIETTFCDGEGNFSCIGYDFSKVSDPSIWAESSVLFDANGEVIYPVKLERKQRELKIVLSRKLSSQLNYPEEFGDCNGKPVNLYMPRKREMFQLEHKVLRRFFKQDDIEIALVHAPAVDVAQNDFLGVIAFIRGNYGVNTITLHPGKTSSYQAMKFFEEEADSLTRLGVTLAYENLTANDRWMQHPEDILGFNFPFVGLTLDVCHLELGVDLGGLIEKVIEKLHVVHLSNKQGNKHDMPYRQGALDTSRLLSALRSNNYQGYIAVDYAQEYKDQEIKDVLKLQEFFR